MTKDEIGEELVATRRSLEAPFARARAAGDTAEMARLQAVTADIDAALDAIALTEFADLAARLTEIRRRIDGRTADAVDAGRGIGGVTAEELADRLRRLVDEVVGER